MAIDADYIQSKFAAFADVDDSLIDEFITIAADFVNSSIWGTKYDFAHALMTCHLMSSAGVITTASGPVESVKVGDLSTTYAVSASDSDSLGTTTYGNLFLQLRRTLLISPIVTD